VNNLRILTYLRSI